MKTKNLICSFAILGFLWVVGLASPAQAVTINLVFDQAFAVASPNFAPGDLGVYGDDAPDNGGTNYFFLEFGVTTTGTITVAAGQENYAGGDLDLVSVALTNVSGGGDPMADFVDLFTEPASPLDFFSARWLALLPGEVYRLTVSYTGGDVFSGNLTFAAVPIPPALLLFGSGLVGLGFLSRRRKRKQTLTTTVRA